MVPLRVRVAGRAVGSGFHSARLFANIDGCGALPESSQPLTPMAYMKWRARARRSGALAAAFKKPAQLLLSAVAARRYQLLIFGRAAPC
jgi:hypothetical protein